MMRRARLPGLLAAALFAGPAVAGDAVTKLSNTGAVTCRPALPYFCDNIHVSCAGRTSLRAFPFTLRKGPGRAWIESEAAPSDIAAGYADALTDWAEDPPYVIFRPREGAGYIKLLATGKYVFRHYVQSQGVMSYGHCE